MFLHSLTYRATSLKWKTATTLVGRASTITDSLAVMMIVRFRRVTTALVFVLMCFSCR